MCYMTVMRETGLIIVSTDVFLSNGTLHQLSLQEGRLIEKQIQLPCEHSVDLLCVQLAGREYLALSCVVCENIKLMDLNKQKGNSSESQLIQYEVIRAFSGAQVYRMCHGGENRLFVRLRYGDVLELDTSATTFTKVRTINTGHYISLCYVPEPHRLLVVNDRIRVRTVSCDGNRIVWATGYTGCAGALLYLPSHEVILVLH